jgi:glycosyltransferase involved in cell wall biosynthesis
VRAVGPPDSLNDSHALTVVVDARLAAGASGGIESVVIGLADALSRLTDGPEKYVFVAHQGRESWLAPFISGSTQLVLADPMAQPSGQGLRAKVATAAPRLSSAWRRTRRASQRVARPARDHFVEALSPDVIHFPFQRGFKTRIANIYHPHDLQHRHLPEFFSTEELDWRETWYRNLCEQATVVAVSSSWTKRDVETQYRLDPRKVWVVPLAPGISVDLALSAAEIDEGSARLALPESYVFYPAQTWLHKNHAALIGAISILRAQDGLVIPLVFSGFLDENSSSLRRAAEELGVADQIHWLGFLRPRDLNIAFAKARGVVIPSLFESASGPLWEAFRAGVPAACSNVTSLPEQAGDAALIFNPHRPEDIAVAIRRLFMDQRLRDTLVERGRKRVEAFTWDRTARTFRAHYRRIGGGQVTDEDHRLLLAPPGI